MNRYLPKFLEILEEEKRFEALSYITDLMQSEALTVLELYEEILTPALNTMPTSDSEDIDIWREHARTSIIKTIMENILPFAQKEKMQLNTPRNKTVAIFCPPEEYHDVGARMASDILSIYGYDTVFVGANTPLRVFRAGLRTIRPDYVAISISNPYHLVSARNIIEDIKKNDPKLKIIVGGYAVTRLEDPNSILKADFAVKSLSELATIEGDQNDAPRI